MGRGADVACMDGGEDLPDYDPDGESDEPSPVEVPMPASSLPAVDAETSSRGEPPSVAALLAPPADGAAGIAPAALEPGSPGAAAAGDAAGASAAAAALQAAAEDQLPPDDDGERWLELLRDSYLRQLREDAELPEPPHFQRSLLYAAAPGVPEGAYPRHVLNQQLQAVRRMHWQGEWSSDSYRDGSRSGGSWSSGSGGSWGCGGRGTPYSHSGPSWRGGSAATARWGSWRMAGLVPPAWAMGDPDANAAAILPQLLGQLQAGGMSPNNLAQVSQQAQAGQLNGILSEVAKKLAAHRSEVAASRSQRGGDGEALAG